MFQLFLLGSVFGAFGIIALQALGLLYLWNRLYRKPKFVSDSSPAGDRDLLGELDPHQSLHFAYRKQGAVWILDSAKVPKGEKVSKEQKRKKELFEVSPVRKHAKISNQEFTLTDLDGSSTTVNLKGCIVEAVSATNLPSRKWAKRFPIKVESKKKIIYSGSKVFYIYLETSWDKEAWCKALRLASCEDKEKIEWFSKLNKDFNRYLATLSTGYPSFMKPSIFLSAEPVERNNRADGTSSKVRVLWKKLSKKGTKHCTENKGSLIAPLPREERKTTEKQRPFPDPVTARDINISPEDVAFPLSSATSRSSSQSQISDMEPEERFISDEGALCWNLLISRLFFDARNNAQVKDSLQARVQRTLSNMRTPSYIGEVICTNVDAGSLPPYLHAMRLLPVDTSEVWAFEVDIEYAGGAIVDVETRLEVCELELQKDIIPDSESYSVGNVSSDLLEGFEDLGKQLNISEETIDAQEHKGDIVSKDGSRSPKGTSPAMTSVSRWKSLVNSVAKQVSQVPLSLSIRVASLRGTLQLHIKPPPSDQLWVGFTSMPDIQFELESSVGERKIASGHIASFLMNRFKAAVRETLVLPNCESMSIPWMLADKDDWVPRQVAPFIWLQQEVGNDNTISRANPGENPETVQLKQIQEGDFQQPDSEVTSSTPLTSMVPSAESNSSSQELKTPLLATSKQQEASSHERGESLSSQSPSPSWYTARSSKLYEKQNDGGEDDDLKPKRGGRKAKMLDLGKKMGEKLEEKRRHLEEKSKSFVGRMRGNERAETRSSLEIIKEQQLQPY